MFNKTYIYETDVVLLISTNKRYCLHWMKHFNNLLKTSYLFKSHRQALMLFPSVERAVEVMESLSERKYLINGRRLVLVKWRLIVGLPLMMPPGELLMNSFTDLLLFSVIVF